MRPLFAVRLALLLPLGLVTGLERLPRTYHYNVEGLRVGPQITLDNPDHPDHPLHDKLSEIEWQEDGGVKTVARTRHQRQLQLGGGVPEPPPGGSGGMMSGGMMGSGMQSGGMMGSGMQSGGMMGSGTQSGGIGSGTLPGGISSGTLSGGISSGTLPGGSGTTPGSGASSGSAPGGGTQPGAGAGNTLTSDATAMALLGTTALTTVQGTIANVQGQPTGTTKNLPVGTTIFGPHEAGFSSKQDGVITSQMGCATTSLCYSDGGVNVKLAEAECAHACSVTLPRFEGGQYYGFLDDCGGHTQYHFHRRLSCLYSESGNHSPKLGEGSNTNKNALYGKWEDYAARSLPQLDACGGHYGVTPDSSGATVYHHHVQEDPPFTYGCFGPNEDGSLVSVAQCRALYSECDGTLTDHTTSEGTIQYDAFCPCYDASARGYDGGGLNTGVNIVEPPAVLNQSIVPSSSPPSSSPSTTFIVTSGNCVATGSCIQHAAYPAPYGNDEACTFRVAGSSNITLSVDRFDVQPMLSQYWWSYGGGWMYDACKDYLIFDSTWYYCGTSGPQDVVVGPQSTIQWASDSSINATGWRICGASPTTVVPSCVCGTSSTDYATFNDASRCFSASDLTNLEVMFSGQALPAEIKSFYTQCSDYDNDGTFRANDLTNMKRYYTGLLPVAAHISAMGRQ